MMMPQTIFPKCKRGIFGLSSWEPQRKPNEAHQDLQKPMAQIPPQKPAAAVVTRSRPQEVVNANGNKNDVPPAAVKAKTKGMQLLARYSYKSNPNSPLGKELNMKPGDRFVLKEKAEMWWLVQNSEGEEGFVPASYMVVNEVNGLPWLQNKEEEKVEPVETTFGEGPPLKARPYQSAYNRDEPKQDEKRWRCDLCDKTLNGPQPYNAHMNSRAHKEEVEYAREMGEL